MICLRFFMELSIVLCLKITNGCRVQAYQIGLGRKPNDARKTLCQIYKILYIKNPMEKNPDAPKDVQPPKCPFHLIWGDFYIFHKI